MLENKIFEISNEQEFKTLALEVFKYQFENNSIYKQFCSLLNRNPENVDSLDQIPFLPIEFFKSKKLITGTGPSQITFSSSGTTGSVTSKHHVTDLRLYEKSFLKAFELFYESPEEYTFLALLPSYLERTGSSLIYMVDSLINLSRIRIVAFI